MKNKLFKIIIIFIFATAFLTVKANAASFTCSIIPNNITASENDEFAVTLKISTIVVTQNGINTVSGFLSYNKDIFQVTGVEGLNNWSEVYFPSNDKIVLTKNTFVKTDEEIVKVTFKVKQGAGKQTSSVALKSISGSNAVEDLSAADVSAAVSLNGQASADNTNSTGNTSVSNSLTNSNNNSSNNGSSNNNRNTNNSNSQNIPKAGIDDTIKSVIFLVFITSYIFYMKYKRLDKIC